MPDFHEIQKALFAARTKHDTAAGVLFRVDEQLKQNAKELAQIERWFNSNNPEHLQARARLMEAQKNLQDQKQENQAAVDHLQSQLADLYPQFWEEWTDPRKHIEKMNDDFPVMLFPLRLETRFKTVGGRDGQGQQLWVRVYPDDCLVDTFEETLSQTELKSAGIFWREYFRAAGLEKEERAAWRTLVASHGAGRAGWIIKHFRPANPLSPTDSEGDATLPIKPQSKATGDLILVVTANSNLTLAEQTELQTYWVAIWRAQNDQDLQTTAFNALIAAVGADRVATLVEQYQPYNLSEKPSAGYTYATANVSVAFAYLPDQSEIQSKSQSWTKPAQANLLPERLVLLGYRKNGEQWQEILNQLGNPLDGPFSVSPNPMADTESQFKFDEHGNLIIGDELRWMMDFDEAVKRGMGFRVNLSSEQIQGFDRLFVLGVRLGSDAEQSKTELETLFKNHYFSRSGFAFLPQGSPTNNTEDGNSAYTRQDDADQSFDFYFKGQAEFSETEDWLDKSDGQWFAESLGLDTDWLKQIPNAGGRDQCEARVMNAALWPATLGYFMDTLLQPVFNDDEIYYTRWFFNRFVSGRGMLPAIRIGRQPYGILPTSAFDRIGWVFGDETVSYLDYVGRFQEQRGTEFKDWLWKFKGILDNLAATWTGLSAQVARVEAQPSPDKDPHQTLLDIVGLHPASVEFYQRYANTKKQEHNIALIWHKFISWQTLPANELHNQAFDRLRLLGYEGLTPPQLFDLFWKVLPNKLLGPVIQEGPLSESDPLRIATDNNRNYIQWLYEWARLSFDTVRVQDGFKDNKSPNALLYILLKHALELGYYDAGVRAMDDAQLLDNQSRLALRSEPHFFHIKAATAQLKTATANTSLQDKSRYELLYTPSERITGDPQKSLVDYLTANLGKLFATRYLDEQLRALNHLQKTPTARLERLLAEHLDCCSYRLDAWMTGLINFQLSSMRFARRGDDVGVEEGVSYRKGLYMGAYGWLENVRSENKELDLVSLKDPQLDEIFNQQIPDHQKTPLVSDSTNQGYIHAPSINHAVTAAVLRNGFIANADDEQADLLKVNLASERVRLALNIIDGIRNAQNLAALLGYQFERGLHDRYSFAEADQFIYPLRKQFPLVTRKEDLPDGVSIEAVEARNVINAMTFIRHIKNAAAADKVYPFGFGLDKLPFADAAQQLVINSEVGRLLDLYDAVADLAIAEGVHQVVMGNYDRAAATLDAYGQATFPPIPDVVQTPRSGIGLTHRVAVHFDSNVAVADTDNPRIKAEPAMNHWLAARLPTANRIACKVTYPHPTTGLPEALFVTQAQLVLQPLDMLYVVNPDNLEVRSELEDRVRHYVMQSAVPTPLPDAVLEISYAQADTTQFSFFEVAPLIRSLRVLLLRSRPLRATDIALPSEASSDSAGAMQLDKSRVAFLKTDLATFDTASLQPLLAQLTAVFPTVGPLTATILVNIDSYIQAMIELCKTLALYGLQQTGFGILLETKGAIFNSLRQLAADVNRRWQTKADDYDALIASLPAQPGDPERIAVLAKAERLIAIALLDPTGKTVAQIQAEVAAKKVLFDSKKALFEAFSKTIETQLSQALNDFNTLLVAAPPYTNFDIQPLSAADVEKAIVVMAEDIYNRLKQLAADLPKRLATVDSKLTEYDGEADADKRLQLLTDAAKTVFGDEFVLVPWFSVSAKSGDEWANAYADRAGLLDHQKTVIGNAFPIDDWLYGTARVREKMHHLENLLFLTEAFQTSLPELRPIQLPFDVDTPWLALEFPETALDKLNRENLLYTALYAGDFNQADTQSGLLLDEWTEVIPAQTETTGITFHFDKPNAEPPQTILLATPTQFNGAWQWQDLVNTLHSTLDRARIRGVEPQQLDKTELSVFLPATILATTWQPITMGADLAIVNNFINKAAP
ncbi:hypothetical protein [Nitrosomonas ureae]|uniref:Uncharacterized protein n=1 Tax=Nitrosomonas ureae TaxID=44577 RepID=A0A1H5XAL9_9PROT|nr:hypothetical protein [Nitrosomonas ureae]SEG08693.1 hypothetical protein SAMN05216334_12536 [Nitrosomonas ureae]